LKFEGEHLGIGGLCFILEEVTSTAERDPGGIIHTQCPPAQVDRVNAIVTCLSRSPVPAPVPVVMDKIVFVVPAGCRALPEIKIEPVRYRNLHSKTNIVTVACIPRA